MGTPALFRSGCVAVVNAACRAICALSRHLPHVRSRTHRDRLADRLTGEPVEDGAVERLGALDVRAVAHAGEEQQARWGGWRPSRETLRPAISKSADPSPCSS